MAWKMIETQGHYNRYKKQPGVNVFSLFDPAADLQEMASIEESIYTEFSDEARNNEVRFYRTRMKLSDSGGGFKVFLNGKKIEHKGILPGALKPISTAINKGLAEEREE